MTLSERPGAALQKGGGARQTAQGVRQVAGGIGRAIQYLRKLAGVQKAAACGDGELLGRFAEGHDEAAFTVLVERHGPMVLGVCRRVLGHAQDAEDACQATFLVLVRKAHSVRKRTSVANWLYGVAYRTARKLKGRRARARAAELPAVSVAGAAEAEVSWREVRAVLDEELQRLPEKYRGPLVLCYLEGLTRDEAARRLGLSANRLRGLLDYGRGLLRARLGRRGLALSAALLAGPLVSEAAAAVPALLVVSTVKAAALAAAGQAWAGLVPAHVAALAEGMVQTMLLSKLKMTAVALLLVAALGAGTSALLPGSGSGGLPGERWALAAPKPARVPARVRLKGPLGRALAELEKVKAYALRPGEVLTFIRPPFPPQRDAFFRAYTRTDEASGMEGFLDLRWQDGLALGGCTVGKPASGRDLVDLLTVLPGIWPQEVEGDTELRAGRVKADFVVRDGAAPAAVVARLQEILNREFDIPVKLTLKEEQREVFVLSGKYTFRPAGPARAANHIELYAEKLGNPRIGGGGSGNAREFAQWLGRFVNRRVVLGKTAGLPARLSWHDNNPEKAFTQQEWEEAHAAGPVLKHVAEQTGLSVRAEKRRARVLVVEKKE
jgi:RNA polymerase sigma factor (sigma-70 family)